MGAIAERLADLSASITDDNPRSEDGDAIVAGIVSGSDATAERARSSAIARAPSSVRSPSAGPGDVVLIAGKGHEDYQIVGTERRHFSDREVAHAALRRQP